MDSYQLNYSELNLDSPKNKIGCCKVQNPIKVLNELLRSQQSKQEKNGGISTIYDIDYSGYNFNEETLEESSSDESEIDYSGFYEDFLGGEAQEHEFLMEKEKKSSVKIEPAPKKRTQEPSYEKQLLNGFNNYKKSSNNNNIIKYEIDEKNGNEDVKIFNSFYGDEEDDGTMVAEALLQKIDLKKSSQVNMKYKPAPPIAQISEVFKCPKCISAFANKTSLRIHMLRKHREKFGTHPSIGNLQIQKVGTTLNTLNRIGSKIQNINNTGFKEQKLGQFSNLTESNKMSNGANSIKCKYCPKDFNSASELRAHLASHIRERPYVCTYCSKRFFQSSHLTVHIRTHTGEKPYQCRFCTNTFNSPSNCRVHERTHMKGNDIFHCQECNIGFLHKSRMDRHLQSKKHIHPNGILSDGKAQLMDVDKFKYFDKNI